MTVDASLILGIVIGLATGVVAKLLPRIGAAWTLHGARTPGVGSAIYKESWPGGALSPRMTVGQTGLPAS